MRLELLVSAVNREPQELMEAMHLDSDAVIINQCGRDDSREITFGNHVIRYFESSECGVGRSRNNALDGASGDIVLFSDEDITYDDGYSARIIEAFKAHPDADVLLFNVRVCEKRRTYYIDSEHKVGFFNSGRYPAYSIAARRERLLACGVRFSLLFGGGAPYSAGEDSLFLMDMVRQHLKIVAVPVEIGMEHERESSWFRGYTEKFFFDRGVLYHFLYKRLAIVFAARFIIAKRKVMCKKVPARKAFRLMLAGIKKGKGLK